jgi:hypothetical protein
LAHTFGMTELSVESGPPVNVQRRARPLGVALLSLGAVGTAVSFAAQSWFTISGPNVITSPDQSAGSGSEPVVLVDPNAGSHHSFAIWAVVVVCILAAVAAQIPRIRLRSVWMAVAVVLAAIGLLDAIERATLPRFAAGVGGLPSGTRVTLNYGVWVAMAGLVLLGVSALVTPTGKVLR